MGFAPDLPGGVKDKVSQVDALIAKNAAQRAGTVEVPSEKTPEQIEAERVEAERIEAERLAVAAVAAQQQGETVPRAEFEKLQQELSTLRGKYEKEPAELARQNSFLQEQIRALQDQVMGLVDQIKVKPAEVHEASFREIIKNEPFMQQFSEEAAPAIVEGVLGVVERGFTLAEERANKRAQQVIDDRISRVDKTLAASAQERFYQDLERTYPNWKTIWADPGFQAYGNEVDDTFGIPRFAAILGHDERGNVFFKTLDAGKVIRFIDQATGGKKEKVIPSKELDLNDPKIAGKIGAPRSSGRSSEIQPGAQISVQEAKDKMIQMREQKNKGQFRGTQEEFDKEFMRLTSIIRKGGAT